MIKKVCFLVNYNQYESKRHFTEKLAEALNRANVETKIVDVDESTVGSTLIDEIIEYTPDFTASFNSFTPLPDNTYLWDYTEIPHLSLLLDPSLYSVNLIESPYSVIACVDQADCYGLSTQGFDRILFIPHAVEVDLFEEPPEEKEYDVVFIGSCYDYETMRSAWKHQLSELEQSVLEEASELFLSNSEIPLYEALMSVWGQKQSGDNEVDFLGLFAYLDQYTRGVDRVELVRSINDAKVHVFGELFEDDPSATKGWQEMLAGKENIVFHEPLDYEESLKVLQKSKICLNSSPFFKHGAHERIFAGFACGAAVLTTENPFLSSIFKDGESIIFYRSKEWEKVNEKINYYLENEDARSALVESGQHKVKSDHTWDHRAMYLRDVMPQMIAKCREKLENA